MSNVIDLTRRRQDGKLRTISKSANALKATYAANPLPAFLQEADLGTIRACYFVVGLPTKEKSFYYDLGWLKLPTGFQLIEYTVQNGKATFDYKEENKVNEAILTPLLLLYKGRETGKEAHICNIFKPESDMRARNGIGGANGCSVTLLPIRDNVLDTTPIKQSNLPFIFSLTKNL